MMNCIAALQMSTIQGTKVQTFVSDIINSLKIKVHSCLFRDFFLVSNIVSLQFKITDTLK